jgi:hypothetical protein
MIELQRLVSEYWWAATLDMAPTKPLPGIRLCTGFCQIQWLVYLKQNPCHTDPLKRTLTQRASGACHGKCFWWANGLLGHVFEPLGLWKMSNIASFF